MAESDGDMWCGRNSPQIVLQVPSERRLSCVRCGKAGPLSWGAWDR